MTPEQQNQIQGALSAIHRMGQGKSPEGIIAELRREGWPEGAIQEAMKQED